MSYDGVIDPDSAAGLAETALEQVLAALARAAVSATAADASAKAAAEAQAAITALLGALGLPVRWTGTSLQIRLPDGSYTPAVDLRGAAGGVGPAPRIVVGTVTEGDFAVIRDPYSPDEAPVLDFVLERGLAAWTPVPAVVTDGDRLVLQIVDWTGGQGVKPAAGLYVGAAGLVADLASGVDLRTAADINNLSGTGTPTPGHIAIYDSAKVLRDGGALSAFGGSLIAAAAAGDVKQLLGLTSGDIGDVTTVGRTLLKAATAAAALAAIGGQAALGFTPENAANKAQANGYAGLDSTGKVPTTQLPASVLGDVRYAGAWNASTNSPAIPAAASGNMGQYYVVQTAGTTTISGQSDWQVGDWLVSNGTGWDKIDNTDAVKSVAGLVGAVTAAALKAALAIASGDITDASTLGRTLLTIASAAALTAQINAVVGDTGSGGTKGLVPAPAAGDAAAGRFLRADGAWAIPAAAFPVSGIVAKTAAYQIVAGDKGTMFDLTGSFALTLPPVSGANALAPLYAHFRKRDGVASPCSVVCSGSDTFANGNTSLNLYQEDATLVSFGGPWYAPPGGRQRGPVQIGTTTISAAVASVLVNAGFTDADFDSLDVVALNIAISANAPLIGRVSKGGVVQSSTYLVQAIGSSSGTASQTGPVDGLYFGLADGSGTANGEWRIHNPTSTVATAQRVRFQNSNPTTKAFGIGEGVHNTANAIDGFALTSSSANLTGGTVILKGNRP